MGAITLVEEFPSSSHEDIEIGQIFLPLTHLSNELLQCEGQSRCGIFWPCWDLVCVANLINRVRGL